MFAHSQWGSELWICFPLSPAQIQLPLRNQTVSIAGVLSLTRAEQLCRCMQHTAHEGGDVPALSSEQLLQHSSSCRGVQRAQSHCCAVCCAGGAAPGRSATQELLSLPGGALGEWSSAPSARLDEGVM